MNPLAQLRAARRKPIAALIGATAGLVPVGVYEVGHYELTSWSLGGGYRSSPRCCLR